jgi:hypothetical protein
MRSTAARICTSLSVFLLLITTSPAHAAWSHEDLALDAAALAQMEQRAEHAEAREQAFLYSELVQAYTQIAGKQMADGDIEQANVTLKHMQHCASMIHASLAKNAKKVKDAEMMMQTATFHLGQYIHLISKEDQALAKSTLHQMDQVHDEMLTQVFAH